MSTVGASNNASDTGLIVQGTLIFLSAVVAVFGYIIQGKLKSKEQKREHAAQIELNLSKAKLARVREQIKTYVGPAFSLCMASHMQILCELCPLDFCEQAFGLRPRKTLWTISNGAIETYHNNHPDKTFSFQRYFNMECNYLDSLVGEEYEDHLRNNPQSAEAIHYRKLLRRVTTHCWVPLHELILKHSQSLSKSPSPERFKKKFPFITSPLLRNQLYLNLICFVEEMIQILEAWDDKDYTIMFPETNPLPIQLFRYFVGQLTELRTEEDAIGMKHEVRSNDETFLKNQIFNSAKSEVKSKGGVENLSKSSSSSNYVVTK